MCERSEKPRERADEGGESPAAITRRTMLLLGAGVAAGMIAGLQSCQPGAAAGARKGGSASPVTGNSSGDSNVQSASSSIQNSGDKTVPADADATAAAAAHDSDIGPDSSVAGTERSGGPGTEPATQTGEAPDLGSAVFPDAAGNAIAKAGDAPVIVVPRSDWTQARPNLKQIAVMGAISRITVHHTAGEMDTDAWQPTAGTLESIREFHSGSGARDGLWADIAYHFAVDGAGRVWQARPLAYQGAHVRGQNEHNAGIVLLGNFVVQSPAAAQLVSLEQFIGFLRGLYKIPLEQIFTLGDLGITLCPGKSMLVFLVGVGGLWGGLG